LRGGDECERAISKKEGCARASRAGSFAKRNEVERALGIMFQKIKDRQKKGENRRTGTISPTRGSKLQNLQRPKKDSAEAEPQKSRKKEEMTKHGGKAGSASDTSGPLDRMRVKGGKIR